MYAVTHGSRSGALRTAGRFLAHICLCFVTAALSKWHADLRPPAPHVTVHADYRPPRPCILPHTPISPDSTPYATIAPYTHTCPHTYTQSRTIQIQHQITHTRHRRQRLRQHTRPVSADVVPCGYIHSQARHHRPTHHTHQYDNTACCCRCHARAGPGG